MNISKLLRPAIGLIAIAGLSACASTDYHFSQLSGTRYFRAPIDTYPVSIVSVDGKNVLHGSLLRVVDRDEPYPRSFSLVDAGMRQVTVQGPPGGAGSFGETRTIPLDVAPCTRYFLVAVKTNALSSDFTVRVDHQEPVGGCTPSPAA